LPYGFSFVSDAHAWGRTLCEADLKTAPQFEKRPGFFAFRNRALRVGLLHGAFEWLQADLTIARLAQKFKQAAAAN
jgi:hypothetical protein